jgi:hypothetical protein
VKRQHGDTLRRFLLDQQLHDTGCLHGIDLEIINRFAQVYEHARHDPAVSKVIYNETGIDQSQILLLAMLIFKFSFFFLFKKNPFQTRNHM